jgi:hypothetical protein
MYFRISSGDGKLGKTAKNMGVGKGKGRLGPPTAFFLKGIISEKEENMLNINIKN